MCFVKRRAALRLRDQLSALCWRQLLITKPLPHVYPGWIRGHHPNNAISCSNAIGGKQCWDEGGEAEAWMPGRDSLSSTRSAASRPCRVSGLSCGKCKLQQGRGAAAWTALRPSAAAGEALPIPTPAEAEQGREDLPGPAGSVALPQLMLAPEQGTCHKVTPGFMAARNLLCR